MMKVFLITPSSSYSIGSVLERAFKNKGCEVFISDFEKEISAFERNINTQIFRFPYKIRNSWGKYYNGKLNQTILEQCNHFKPDLIFIYNDCHLLPETIKTLRKRYKVAFYLGDNPFYTWTKPLFLNLLMEADWIFAPDTMWIEQLKMMGIKKIHFEILGWDDEIYYPIEPTDEDKKRYTNDLIFIGNSYVINWGFKRTLFLNQFKDLNIKIYGTHHWYKWLKYFPGLKDRFVLLKKPMPLEKVNLISNCCKIYPVDANPGLLNGIHARVFDCIGSSILPLVEYRKDLDFVFNGIALPTIKHYNEGKELAKYFLKYEKERKVLLNKLTEKVKSAYTPDMASSRILELIFS